MIINNKHKNLIYDRYSPVTWNPISNLNLKAFNFICRGRKEEEHRENPKRKNEELQQIQQN